MTYLIADCGSTKSSWVLVEGEKRQNFETLGINPIRDSEDEIEQVLMNLPVCLDALDIIHFYGAGCIPPYSDVVRRLLARRFPKAEIHVESDLLGAAHALCGKNEGIACILGTGSNSCLYDGRHIVENVSPLGWILGDEGSGAVLGPRLVGDVLK
ncbi:MAG: ATPase, partial [Bacteroidaceae bacterium]|nr:ATPase [Bacteroidaceae bacterium]